jgi:hypothetical protein
MQKQTNENTGVLHFVQDDDFNIVVRGTKQSRDLEWGRGSAEVVDAL